MFSTALLLAASMVVGQAEGNAIPPDISKELDSLTGTWEVTGTFKGNKIEGTWSARWAPGKHCLMRRSSLSGTPRAKDRVIGIGVIGWDGATETITEQVFNDDNTSALVRWKVLPSGDWEGEVSGFREGQKFVANVKMKKSVAEEITYEEIAADGTGGDVLLRRTPEKQAK